MRTRRLRIRQWLLARMRTRRLRIRQWLLARMRTSHLPLMRSLQPINRVLLAP
jgi:hypothetical protein